LTNFVDLENLEFSVVTSSEEVDRLGVPGEVLGLVSDWLAFLSVFSLLNDDILAWSNDDLRGLLSIVVNEEDLGVSGDSNPVLDRRDLNVIDDLVDLPLLDWSLEVGVLPELDLSVFTSGDEVLSVLVDVKSVDWSVVSFDWSLALTKDRPDLEVSVPSDGDEVIVLWVGRGSEFGDSVSVSWLRGLGLELTNSVPDGRLAVETSGVDDLGVNWDGTRVDLFLSTEEGLLERPVDDVPKSQGAVPRGGKENLVVRTELEISNEVVVSGQSVLWKGDGAEVVSGVVVEVPDKNLLVSSSSDEEGSGAVLERDASRGDGRDLGLVSFDELFG